MLRLPRNSFLHLTLIFSLIFTMTVQLIRRRNHPRIFFFRSEIYPILYMDSIKSFLEFTF